jgi:ubiquinone/menaquinone biosynthesis C-methylase UbiE
MTEQNKSVDWGLDIHNQFKRQAKWTADFRKQIYRHVNLRSAQRILDVGCGTGVIAEELKEKSNAKITAIDIDEQMIAIAKDNINGVQFLVEDAYKLPMKDNYYDVVVCQYLFLWLVNPEKAIKEMVRVCRKGGYVVALAEPDYGGWIEYPEMDLGKKHIRYLEREGADPEMGRKMLSLFEKAELKTYLVTIAQSWDKQNLLNNIEEEWKRVLDAKLISEEEYKEIIKEEIRLIKKNQRMIFMPVFCAIGQK